MSPNESETLARATLQRSRAELEACLGQIAAFRALSQSNLQLIREMDRALAVYFGKTKNPFKLLWNRLRQPGAMRRERKEIEVILQELKTRLKNLPERKTEPPENLVAPVTSLFQTNSGVAQRHHAIITGTGRAGTTFLVELLTALGLDTGFEHYSDLINDHSKAGLEKDISAPDSPYIIKNPQLCDTLGPVLDGGGVVIDHAFLPMRDLSSAARSRERISALSAPVNDPARRVPGGLWSAANATEQEIVLAQKLSQLIVVLAGHNVPTTLLFFPRLVEDAPYLYEKLTPILVGMSFAEFEPVFRQVARPALVTRELSVE